MANTSIYSAFERMWQHVVAALGDKVTKVDGKGLSTNDFTNEYKSKVDSALQSFTETDPTVPAWAKAATKPTYTAEEVGLGNVDNTADSAKSVKYATSAGSATKATQDANGNVIADTYVDKSGDTMTGNLTINKSVPCLKLNNPDTGRITQVYSTSDNYTVLYNCLSEDTGNKRAGLWIAPETITDDNLLLRVQKKTGDSTSLYKVLHEGTDEVKKLGYTNIAYGTCSTAAATAAKVVTISGNTNWSLTAGSIITIKFANTNTAQNPTLNVNGTGAKSIWYSAGVVTTSALNMGGYANRPMIYMYDGTQYVFLGWSYDANTTYSNASLGQGYGTCSTAAATAAKEVALSSYSLIINGIVAVKFTYAVPANATLNINSKGAKAIYHNGAAITAGVINAGDIATFIYDGTQYQLIAVDKTNINYPATITTTWTGSAAPYTQDITVTGITANDKPIIDLTFSDTYSTDQLRLKDWDNIYRIVTAADKITVYATEKTTTSLPIQLQVVK